MNSKKVLAILGSPRADGVTATMLDYSIREAEKAGYIVSKINLYEKQISFCTGCRRCLDSGMCIQKDDMQEIVLLFHESQIVLLAAPTYWANVPAPVKNLFDRMLGTAMQPTATFPQPRLSGKQYLLLTACHTPSPWCWVFNQSRSAFHNMEEFFKTAGMRPLGKVVCANSEKIHTPTPKALRQIAKAFC